MPTPPPPLLSPRSRLDRELELCNNALDGGPHHFAPNRGEPAGAMDWDKLKTFHYAAETGSLTAAAEKLG